MLLLGFTMNTSLSVELEVQVVQYCPQTDEMPRNMGFFVLEVLISSHMKIKVGVTEGSRNNFL